jgi:transposase-like protein
VEPIEILTEPERRRTAQEKIAIVQETLAPGASVSAVARRHGVNPNQVFGWRKQYQEGSLAAVKAGETVVPASELAAAIKEIKELQRLLGKNGMDASSSHNEALFNQENANGTDSRRRRHRQAGLPTALDRCGHRRGVRQATAPQRFSRALRQSRALSHWHGGMRGSQHWARRLTELGHQVKLMPGKQVKAFVTGNKNDVADARAIWAAARHPGVKAVPVKTEAQQAVLALHRIRQQLVIFRRSQSNCLRGLLGEYGEVMGVGRGAMNRAMPDLLLRLELRLPRVLIDSLREQWQRLVDIVSSDTGGAPFRPALLSGI